MIALTEKYRPYVLREITGQPCIPSLVQLVAHPRPCAVLLAGPTGTGKTSAARALANELRCFDGAYPTSYTICGAEMNSASVVRWFGPQSPFTLPAPCGWHCLIIERLEDTGKRPLAMLETVLETRLVEHANVVVITTANKLDRLPTSLLDRFRRFDFDGGAILAAGFVRYLRHIWAHEAGREVPMPAVWRNWGWSDGQFSARRALDALEDSIRERLRTKPAGS